MDYLLENVMFVESKKNENNKWDIIENKMNFKFPQDYKEFIDIYGEGGINGFLSILSPFSKYNHLNLVNKFHEMKNAYDYMKNEDSEQFFLNFYEGEYGIFPWAVTDNGDELYWNVKEDGIEIIIYASRYSDMEVFNMGTTEFLYKLLSKDLICSIFPDDFLIDSNYYEL